MTTTDMVYSLALITLAVFLVWGVWQYFRAKQARRNNEHSALSDAKTVQSSERMERDPSRHT